MRIEAVLELLPGRATVDPLARRFGVRASTVEGWCDRALEGIGESLRQGTGKSSRELELQRDLTNLEKAFTHLADSPAAGGSAGYSGPAGALGTASRGLGCLVYCGYVVWIGGSFLSRRHGSVPIVLAALVLV